MSFETALLALLNPLCGDHVYWDALPEGTKVTLPTILLEHSGGRGRQQYIEGGVSANVHARVRVTVMAPKNQKQEVCDLSRLVEKTLANDTMYAGSYGAFSSNFQPGLTLHENYQDFGLLYADA